MRLLNQILTKPTENTLRRLLLAKWFTAIRFVIAGFIYQVQCIRIFDASQFISFVLGGCVGGIGNFNPRFNRVPNAYPEFQLMKRDYHLLK
jgi:hypothetical protein